MRIGTITIFLALIGIITFVSADIYAAYRYDNEVLYAWSLADKSSTLTEKSRYMDEFITNIEHQPLAEYDALILKTPDNNVKRNLDAIKSLRQRLDEIKDLDPESFAYQTAIQQITAQEQGEASQVLGVIQGAWTLKNYPYLWGWINVIILGGLMVLLCLGVLSNSSNMMRDLL